MAGQASKVSGVVQIDGAPVQRTVRAFGYDAIGHTIDGIAVNLSMSLGQATSDPATGDYTIDLLAGYDQHIFVVAFDDYGSDFVPDMTVAVGDRVHPSTPNGYVWECTSEGSLPTEEPAWVVDAETAQLYGTASMIAKPFYRPMVHGPVNPEVTAAELWTPAKITTALWLDGADPDALVLDNNGNVSEWSDKSGNNRNALQTTASLMPNFADLNGISAPNFSGATMKVQALSEPIMTLIFVAKCESKENVSLAGAGNDSYLPIASSTGGTNTDIVRINGVKNPEGSIILLNGDGAQTVTGRADIHTALVAESPTIVAFTGIPAISTGWEIGRGGGSSNWNWNGPIGEVIAVPGTPNTADRQKMEGYLAHKWGLVEKLPQDHPYKLQAPSAAS